MDINRFVGKYTDCTCLLRYCCRRVTILETIRFNMLLFSLTNLDDQFMINPIQCILEKGKDTSLSLFTCHFVLNTAVW